MKIRGSEIPLKVLALTFSLAIPFPGDAAPLFKVRTEFPDTDDYVRCITIDRTRDIVYIGGDVTTVGGQARSRVAAIDANTGSLLPWNPGANGSVRAIAVDADTVYLGGSFSEVGGQTHHYVAATDMEGNVLTWNPDSDE